MAIIKESNLQISLTSNSFHQLFAKQISSAAVALDLFVVWCLDRCNKCHWVHGSFSGKRGDLHMGHTRLIPTGVLSKMKYKCFFLREEVMCSPNGMAWRVHISKITWFKTCKKPSVFIWVGLKNTKTIAEFNRRNLSNSETVDPLLIP